MLKFECKELGANCSYVVKGNSLEEVKKIAIEHAQTVHKDWLAKKSPQQMADIDKTLTRINSLDKTLWGKLVYGTRRFGCVSIRDREGGNGFRGLLTR